MIYDMPPLLAGLLNQPGMAPPGISDAMRGILTPSAEPQAATQPSMAQRYADAIRATIKGGGQTTIADQLSGVPSIGWPSVPSGG